ncbi:DUF6760 family protein [Pseudobutyrivibrio ruminis]|uniref:DUF6760 family protein n=1 Tax=Pseudobutyrivibrio ruminis TaxID=46206 RepID=UPI003FA6D525
MCLSRLWEGVPGTYKFYRRGLKLYPQKEMYEEMSFISYYFHWGSDDVLSLEHNERRRWCKEISSINQSLRPSDKPKEKSILEMRPSRSR